MKNQTVKSETPATYKLESLIDDQNVIIARALEILQGRIKERDTMGSPKSVRNYLKLKLHDLEHEVFGGLFLDAQNQLIEDSQLFRGTIDGSAVYPREVVKEALKHNACSVIFYHNHPSGISNPSQADHRITERLKEALELIDIRVLDHLIVGDANHITSFAESGWI